MNTETALKILDFNCKMREESFIQYLYEYGTFGIFCEDDFWNLYDAIMTLAKREFDKNDERNITMQIFRCYSLVLKSVIYNFDKDNDYEIDLPENYYIYIDRLDAALDAYFTGNFIDEKLFMF